MIKLLLYKFFKTTQSRKRVEKTATSMLSLSFISIMNTTLLKPTLIITTLLSIQFSTSYAKGPKPSELGAVEQPIGSEGVIWYTTWESATEEAKRSNRPIFFMSAAYQCSSVSGTF